MPLHHKLRQILLRIVPIKRVSSRTILEKQRQALKRGIETKAAVMGVRYVGQDAGQLVLVHLQLKIEHHEQNIQFISCQSFIASAQIPMTGDVLRIKYHPGEYGVVQIL
ncbi:MAG: hypothetical protein JNM44_11300 [Chitinophagaceae bacterium]|nr:hypothetical protein [Chitinophagaceae bacterium]